MPTHSDLVLARAQALHCALLDELDTVAVSACLAVADAIVCEWIQAHPPVPAEIQELHALISLVVRGIDAGANAAPLRES